MKLKTLASLFVACGLVLSASPSLAAKTMKVGLGVPESHFEVRAMKLFKEHVESKTNGEIKVDLYPATQLGNDKEVLESIKVGVAHMNLPGPAVLGNFVKDFTVVGLPYLFATQEIADEVCDGPWGQALLKKLEAAGFVGLGFGDFGYRHVTNNVRPITKLEDIKGLKIRVMQNPSHLATFRTLGANPTAMAFSEVFSGLQQGVIDGQENPLKNITSNKLYEVQKHLTLTGHVYEWIVFVVGKKFYDSLTPEQRTVMQEATVIARDYMRTAVKQDDAEALEEIRKAGVQVVELTPAEAARIREAALKTVEVEANKINAQLYQDLQKAIEAASTK